jgi:bifunctional DNA-binding transcriptional regulator/antitoxin component of YhaV-PrlF toxin-antitoxin module
MELKRVDMAAEGVVRKIDKLGRIVLPTEFRRSLGL